jgi:hypothetical protein
MPTARLIVLCVLAALALVGPAVAQDWSTVPYIQHSTYQAVNADGTSAYGGAFPVKFVGVVLNNNEDWLDPTAAYDSGVHLWNMGGEGEFYLQAVDLDGTDYDPFPGTAFADFGGTACWMGQNYGNHIKNQDPTWNYTDSEWYAELDRLGLWRPGTPLTASELVRPGDLVEVRVRGGLHYKGKMNVNEQHSNAATNDFEIEILQKGFGLPQPTALLLSDLKSSDDVFLFDATRQTGGEAHQSSLVELVGLQLAGSADWTAGSDIAVTDGTRTMNMHVGLDDGFDGSALVEAGETFSAVGVLDQSSGSGTGGYQLLVMNPGDISVVPEPLSVSVFAVGGLALLRRRRRT